MACFKQKYPVLMMINQFEGLNFVSYNRIWKQAEAEVVPSSSSVQFKIKSDLVC